MKHPVDRRRGSGLVALATAGALFALSACGSSDGSESSDTAGAPTSTSYFSPLDEFLNPSAGAQPTTDEEYAAKEKQVQELVASCMTDQGFDYEPFVYPMMTGSVDQGQDSYGTREWVEQYGYGLSTMDDRATSSSSGPEVSDPNGAIVEAMSDSERDAYYIALYGGSVGFESAVPMSTSSAAATSAEGTGEVASTEAASTDPASTESFDPATETVEDSAEVSIPEPTMDSGFASMPALADQGCWGQAQAEVYGDSTNGGNGPKDEGQFQDMWDAQSKLYEDIDKDPRVADAVQAWVDCMSGAGYPGFSAIWDANQQASEKWGELNGWNVAADGGGGVSMGGSTDAPEMPPAPPADEVATFREYEIKIALADFDCRKSSNYETVQNEVRIELETQFVEDHRAELEQYRDMINGGG